MKGELFFGLIVLSTIFGLVYSTSCPTGFDQVSLPSGIKKSTSDPGFRCCPSINRSIDSEYELQKTAWYAVQVAYNPGNTSFYTPDLFPTTDIITRVDSDWVDGTYIILFDHCLQAVVIAIRGTVTIGDDLQDIQGYATNFVNGTFAHIGFLHRTNYLYAHHISAITESVRQSKYRILTTGHSLGAGVASLLALKLQDPNNPFAVPNTTISGYGYAVPGPTFYDPKGNLAAAEKNWKSFIYHDDIVARVTWPGTLNLLSSCSSQTSNATVTIHPDIHDYMLLWLVVQQFSFCAGNTSSGLTKPGAWYYSDHYSTKFSHVARTDKAVDIFEFWNSSLADHSGYNYLGTVNRTFEVPLVLDSDLLKVDPCPPSFTPIKCDCEWVSMIVDGKTDQNETTKATATENGDEITTNSLPATHGSKVIGFVGFHYITIHPNQPMLLSNAQDEQNKAKWISVVPLDKRMIPKKDKNTPKNLLMRAVAAQDDEFVPAAGTISKYWNLMIVINAHGKGKMWSLDRNEILRDVEYKGIVDASDIQILEHTYPLMVLITDKGTGKMSVFRLKGGEANRTTDFIRFKGTQPMSVAVNGNFSNRGQAFVVDSDNQIVQVNLDNHESKILRTTIPVTGAQLIEYSDGMLYVYSKQGGGVIYIIHASSGTVMNAHKVTLAGVDSMVVDHRLVIFRSSVTGNNQLIYNPYAGQYSV